MSIRPVEGFFNQNLSNLGGEIMVQLLRRYTARALPFVRAMLMAAMVVAIALASSTTPARAALTDGLLGYWPFEGNALDMSGNGRDLSLFGGAGFGPGLIGQGLALPGNSSSYAQRPLDDTVFDFGSSDFTIQVWFNFNINNREQTL